MAFPPQYNPLSIGNISVGYNHLNQARNLKSNFQRADFQNAISTYAQLEQQRNQSTIEPADNQGVIPQETSVPKTSARANALVFIKLIVTLAGRSLIKALSFALGLITPQAKQSEETPVNEKPIIPPSEVEDPEDQALRQKLRDNGADDFFNKFL